MGYIRSCLATVSQLNVLVELLATTHFWQEWSLRPSTSRHPPMSDDVMRIIAFITGLMSVRESSRTLGEKFTLEPCMAGGHQHAFAVN